jgi:hypothetical protein
MLHRIVRSANRAASSVWQITSGLFPGEQRAVAHEGIVLITDETER